MEKQHYLGLWDLVGQTLLYVAVYKGKWLALLGWQGAALKCRARDQRIGWSPVIQYQRLHLMGTIRDF